MNHSTSTKYGATFRSLYVNEIESVQKSYIYKINDMMKSLICELDRAILDGEHTGYLSKIKSLISDQFERLSSENCLYPGQGMRKYKRFVIISIQISVIIVVLINFQRSSFCQKEPYLESLSQN